MLMRWKTYDLIRCIICRRWLILVRILTSHGRVMRRPSRNHMFLLHCKLQLHPSMWVDERSKEKDREICVCDRVSGISHAFPSLRPQRGVGCSSLSLFIHLWSDVTGTASFNLLVLKYTATLSIFSLLIKYTGMNPASRAFQITLRSTPSLCLDRITKCFSKYHRSWWKAANDSQHIRQKTRPTCPLSPLFSGTHSHRLASKY